MIKEKRVVGVIIREGVCQKSDEQIMRGALMGRLAQLEQRIARVRLTASEMELKALQDEYERTYALTEWDRLAK